MKFFTLLALAIITLSSSIIVAHGCETHQQTAAEEASLGLQAAKRVVRNEVAERVPARAFGWSNWMVQKYKKSAFYQSGQKKVIEN